MKICSKCNIEKDLSCFGMRRRLNVRGELKETIDAQCKSCGYKAKYARIKNNPEQLDKLREKWRLRTKKNYNIDPSKSAARSKKFVEVHKEKGTYRNKWLKSKYGITIDQYNHMLENQENSCAICKIPQSAVVKNLHVDHCHTTGKVRGLLCTNCNSLLGHAKDNIATLRGAINYLVSC